MWRCGACGESLEDQFTRCWRCDIPRQPEATVEDDEEELDLGLELPPIEPAVPGAPRYRADAGPFYNQGITWARLIMAHRLYRERRERTGAKQFPERDRLWQVAKIGAVLTVASVILRLHGAALHAPPRLLLASPWLVGGSLVVAALCAARVTRLELGDPF
jgi:hypothetical protein